MDPFIPGDKMFGKNVSRHHIGHTIVKIDVWTCNPLMEPGYRNAMRSSDVTQGRGTARTHDTGRGLIVLVDLEDYGAIENLFPQREGGQACRPDCVVRTHNFGLHGRMTNRGLLFCFARKAGKKRWGP